MSYNKSMFEQVPDKVVNKSKFNLSHEYKTQLLPGYLVPVLVMETLPGDDFDLDAEFMFRFSPLHFPIMHKMTMRADWFFVNNDMLWPYESGTNKGWKKWIAENSDENPPYFSADMGFDSGGGEFPNYVLAFMGIPLCDTGLTTLMTTTIDNLNAFPLSAYLKIWDEYYRNPQLEEELWFPLEDGDNTTFFNITWPLGTNLYTCLKSKWEKDYFTSAIPSPQLGDAINVPIFDPNDPRTGWVDANLGTPVTGAVSGATTPGGLPKSQIGATDVVLDVTATIRHLREAEVKQSYYERIMKVGQRFRDWQKGLYGVDPEPLSVQVPVLIGSKFGRVQIADVMATASATSPNTRVGDYRGQANMYSNDGGQMKYFCRQHGWLMCILQVNPNTSYGQGIHRMWRRTVQTEYALDMFSSIGDQEILKEEVFYPFKTADAGKGDETFGYIPRFAEYKYMNNLHTGMLNHLFGKQQHLGRWWDPQVMAGASYDTYIAIDATDAAGQGTNVFTSAGANNALIGGDIRLTDVFRILPSGTYTQYPAEGVIYAHIFHTIWVNRPLPFYSTPKL